MSLKIRTKIAMSAVCALAIAGLAGCGADDIQLNGKIFDAVGINTGSVKSKEPKMAARAPLVVPPGLDKLPEPGSGKASQPELADVVDPDANQLASRAELERQQAAYCKVHYTDAKTRGEDDTADLAEGPLGSCRGSVLTAIKNINKGDDTDGQ